LVTNVDGTANADFDLIITNAGANNFLIKTVVVPADSAIVAVDKSSSFYLLENSKIGGAASAAGDLVYITRTNLLISRSIECQDI
jgi:hypothetical protein